tara:strand:+ start:2660 stop:3298 length:639 start_codon:yes stop_codon:yes gene_type:complete
MNIKKFPEKIAVFPLSSAIFFPNTILPLNIFEKRYIQMIEDCMKNQKMFGMIQPKIKSSDKPEVYNVGCLGKIVNFQETEDKRFIISLSGIIRFRIKEEIETNKLYREFKVDYSEFAADLDKKDEVKIKFIDSNLLNKIKTYFYKKNYLFRFDDLEELDTHQLIDSICMICPFSVQEKQKLIETIKMEDKITLLEEIINFSLANYSENKTIQ